MSKKKVRMGRPPMPSTKRRARIIGVRVTVAELGALRAEAKRQGLSLTNLLLKPWREPQGEREG
jgi:hypothetical protein